MVYRSQNHASMYVIKKMQINKAEIKPYVSNRQMFLMQGAKPAAVESKDTADCCNDVLPQGARKTQMLGFMDDKAKTAYAKRESNGQADSLKPENPRDK